MIGLLAVYGYILIMVGGIALAGCCKYSSWGEWWRS